MEIIKWWTWLLLVSGIVAVVLLVSAPFGFKAGIFELRPSFISLILALFTGFLVLLGSIVMGAIAIQAGLAKNRNLIIVALVLGAVPVAFIGPQIIKARSVPAIHDISTDTTNPPQFDDVVVKLREAGHAVNSLKYGDGATSVKAYAELQQKSYPNVKSLHTDLTVADAVVHARDVLSAQGLEIVNADPQKGIVEAVATSRWFGFKDDVVVRVTPDDSGTGSIVDVRSVSRVGVSDLGVNARRIVSFLNAF